MKLGPLRLEESAPRRVVEERAARRKRIAALTVRRRRLQADQLPDTPPAARRVEESLVRFRERSTMPRLDVVTAILRLPVIRQKAAPLGADSVRASPIPCDMSTDTNSDEKKVV